MKLTESNSVNLAKPLAESAVAPGECGSVPDEQVEFELFHTNKYGGVTGGFRDGHYIYAPVQARWEAWQARAALGMQPPNTVERDLDCSTPTSEQPREVLIQRLEACQRILADERVAFDALVSACQRALSHYESIRGDKEDTALMTNLRHALRLAGAA